MSENIRICKQCTCEIRYANRSNYLRAIKKDSICKKCMSQDDIRNAKIGNAHVGMKRHPSVGQKISKIKTGHEVTQETRAKIGKSQRGKVLSISHKKKISKGVKLYYTDPANREKKREEARKHNIDCVENGWRIVPGFNPKACDIIDEYGKQHGYAFQHAKNGGEISPLGLSYFADGYDIKNNVWIEVDEPFHFKGGELRPQDIQRQNEIIEALNCKFIRIKFGEENGR